MALWSTQTATRECQIAANGELTVVERLANLLETGNMSDVTIKVGEGDDAVSFKAHRLLLATASQPLNKLMTKNLNGTGDMATLKVPDMDPDAFQHVLKYIYTDDLEIDSVEESMALLKTGKKWCLPNLTEKTIKFLDIFLNEYEPTSEDHKNDLCDLTVLSEEYDLTIKEKCWSVLIKNVNDVVPCQGFLNMTKEMVRRLLGHKDFQFKNQLTLFEAIRDWGMNQVLQNQLSVNSLQGLIGEFINFIDFRAIQDMDFLDTILPSECMGKSELIAFFLARGMEIPRDLIYKNYNNDNKLESNLPFEKTGRFKRGFKLPTPEIYKEHELRFRVDKKLRLLGVGFGFLFSNTDMGITVHCKGPWETRQWSDIIQTYCRVSFEKMKSADVRLMFSEPVIIEPHHSYKILVRVSRMSTGTSDVELWGGTQGSARLKMKDAEIDFLKAAVDPDKEVEDEDRENKPGMITDLFYELDDGSTPINGSYTPYHDKPKSPVQAKKKFDLSIKSLGKNDEKVKETTPKSPISSAKDFSVSSSSPSSYSYRKTIPSSNVKEDSSSPPPSTTRRRKSQVDEAASYYLSTRPSDIRNAGAMPAFLRSQQPSVEKSKPDWQIPSRPKISSLSAYKNYSSRDRPSVNRDTTKDKETISSRRGSKTSDVFSNTSLSKYSSGISSLTSKYESSLPTTPSYMRKNYESPISSSITSKYSTSKYSTPTSSSLYGTQSPIGRSESRFGSTLKPASSYTSKTSESRYGAVSPSSAASSTSERVTSPSTYGSSDTRARNSSTYGSSDTRTTRNSVNRSPSRFRGTSPAVNRYGKTSTEVESSKPSGISASSRYGTSNSLSSIRGNSKYGSSSLDTNTTTPISNRYTSALSNKTGTSSVGTGRYDSNTSSLSNKPESSRFNSTTSTGTGNTGSSRYGSSGTSNYLSSNRYGTSTPFGSTYTSSLTPRYGSSIYRR